MLEFKHTYNFHQWRKPSKPWERDEKIVYACIDKYLSSTLYILGSKEGKLTALTNF